MGETIEMVQKALVYLATDVFCAVLHDFNLRILNPLILYYPQFNLF